MAHIIIPSRWTRRPSYPVTVDRSHWALGPTAIFHPMTPSAMSYDAVNNTVGTTTGSPRPTDFGVVTSSGNSMTGGARPIFTGTTLTVVASLRTGAASPGGIRHFLGCVGDVFLQGICNIQTTYYAPSFNVRISNAYRLTSVPQIAATPAVGDRIFLGARFNQPSWRPFISLNGSALTIGNDASFGAPLDDEGGALLLGRNNANDLPSDFDLGWVLITSRLLNDSQLLSLRDEPYQLFRPITRCLYFGAAAATGTPVLSAATVTNIQPTQATPRVTVTFS